MQKEFEENADRPISETQITVVNMKRKWLGTMIHVKNIPSCLIYVSN